MFARLPRREELAPGVRLKFAWTRTPPLSLLMRGVNSVTFRLHNGYALRSNFPRTSLPLTNREFLEMAETCRHAFTSNPAKGSSHEEMLMSWLATYSSIDTDNKDCKQLKDRVKNVKTSAQKKIDAYNKSKNKRQDVGQPLLDKVFTFLDSTFNWENQRQTQKGVVTKQMASMEEVSEEMQITGGPSLKETDNSSIALPPIYSSLFPNGSEAFPMHLPSPLPSYGNSGSAALSKCPPSPPPSYAEAVQSQTEKRMCLRNATSYNSSPGKLALKEQLRKATSSLTRCKRKLEEEQNNNRKMKKMVGVRQRELHDELEKTKEALTDQQQSARKDRDKGERLKTKEIQELRETFAKDMERMEKETMAWKGYATDLLDKSERVDKAESTICHLKKTNYNLSRKLFRRDEAIPKLRERLDMAQKKVKEAEALMEDQSKKHEVDKAALQGIMVELEDQLADKEDKIVEMKRQIDNLKSLETKKNGVYSTQIRLTYYHLLQLGVSCNKIESVVRSVLENLTAVDMKNTPLPQRSLAQRMKLEAGCLAQIRGMVEWSRREDKRVGYHSDKSPKTQLEWLTHKFILSPTASEQAEGKRTTFTLSLAPVSGGTAQDSLDDLVENLSHLSHLAEEYGIEDARNVFSIKNISAKMSDRAATEMRHTKLLESAKNKELQETERWQEKTEEEKEEMTRIVAFTCSMHKLHNVAESVTKSCSEFLYKEESHQKSSRQMIGAKKHVYETDKLLCTESKKEIAEGKQFKAYCLAQDVVDVAGCELFQPIVGTRYFIFLLNSIPTFCGQEFIKTFLLDQKDMRGYWNRLEKSVYDGYSCHKTTAEERAYGILYHTVFLPLYRKFHAATSPLVLNPVYMYTLSKLQEWGDHPEPLFQGNDQLYEDLQDPKYEPYIRKIRESHPTDDLVIQILGVACKAAYDKLKSHASEHLPGGEYNSPSQSVISAAGLLDGSTNDTCESDFGVLDRQCHAAPSGNPLSISAMVRAKRDHVTEWAAVQSREDQEKAVTFARTTAAKLHETKDKQLAKLHAAKEPLRREKIQKRRLNQSKKAALFASRLQAVRDGKLVLNKHKVNSLSATEVLAQMQLWVMLKEQQTIHKAELLKGRSKLKLSEKKKLLKSLIKENQQVAVNLGSCEQDERVEDVDMSSDGDEDSAADDIPLAQLKRKGVGDDKSGSSSDEDIPLRTLVQRKRSRTGDDKSGSSSDEDIPLQTLVRRKRSRTGHENS